MSGDISRDIEAVMAFLGREFSCGNDKVSARDNIGDGRLLGDVVGGIAGAVHAGGTVGLDPEAAAVIRCLSDVFGGGYELADQCDETETGLTLAEAAGRLAPRAVGMGA